MANKICIAETLLNESESAVDYRFEWLGPGNKRKLYLLKCKWENVEECRLRSFALCDQSSVAGVIFISWQCKLEPDCDRVLKGDADIDESVRSLALKFESADDVDFPKLIVEQPSKPVKKKQLRKTSKMDA